MFETFNLREITNTMYYEKKTWNVFVMQKWACGTFMLKKYLTVKSMNEAHSLE